MDTDALAESLLNLGSSGGTKSAGMPMDTPVFQVNEKVFLMRDLSREANRLLHASGREWTQEQVQQMGPTLQREAQRSLISRHLSLEEAEKTRVPAPLSAVQEELTKIERSLPDGKTLEDFIKAQGMSKATLIQRIRDDLRFNTYQKMILDSVTAPTVEEVKAAYEKHRDKFVKPEQRKIQHLFKAFTPDMDEAAKTKLEGRMDALRNSVLDEGADFTAIIKRQSDAPDKEQGGEALMIRGAQAPELEATYFDLPAGELSDVVVEADRGIHLIKMLEHVPERQLAFKEVKERLNQMIIRERQTAALREDQLRLQTTATITQRLNAPDEPEAMDAETATPTQQTGP